MKKQRDLSLDCLKAFAIFLVLWGHCIQYFSATHYSEQPLYRIIYSFHMPLFMALVGYFASSLLNIKSFVEVLWKKGRQLLIPAFVMLSIMCLLQVYAITGVVQYLKVLVIHLWFLKVAFLCTMLFYIFAYNKKFRATGILISLVISQFIHLWYWSFNIMYPCFILGYILHTYRGYIERYATQIIAVSGCIFCGMLISWDSSFWEMPKITINFSSPEFTEYWWKTLYRLMIGVAGTVLFFTFFITVVDRLLTEKIKERFQLVGTRTLGIYLIQSVLVESFLSEILNFDTLNPTLYNLVITPLFAIVALFICYFIVRLLEQTKITSIMLLGKTTQTRKRNVKYKITQVSD